MADSTLIAFLRIDLQDIDSVEPTPLSVRAHTATGTYYPKGTIWASYLGAGNLLSVSGVANESTTSANEFSVSLSIPDEKERSAETANLFDNILSTSLENRPVCLHAVEIADLGAPDPPEPQLVLVGKVGNVEMTAAQISLKVYSAATLLNQVVNVPSRYTDITHKRFVDKTDQVMRFQTDTTTRDTYFP